MNMTDETKDTQPLIKDILEEMRTGFALLREEMRTGFAAIEARLDSIEKRLTIIEKKIDILNKEMLHMRAEYELLDERLTKLEGGSGIQ